MTVMFDWGEYPSEQFDKSVPADPVEAYKFYLRALLPKEAMVKLDLQTETYPR
jgi:hypothetical protein